MMILASQPAIPEADGSGGLEIRTEAATSSRHISAEPAQSFHVLCCIGRAAGVWPQSLGAVRSPDPHRVLRAARARLGALSKGTACWRVPAGSHS